MIMPVRKFVFEITEAMSDLNFIITSSPGEALRDLSMASAGSQRSKSEDSSQKILKKSKKNDIIEPKKGQNDPS